MNQHHTNSLVLIGVGLAILILLTAGQAIAQDRAPGTPLAPLGTGFSYQGQLKDAEGNPINTSCDFRFILYNAEVGGSQVGLTQEKTAVAVAGGYFTVVLEFGSDAFTGEALWLEAAVKCSGDAGYAVLVPRQALTAAPYASYAPAAGIAGSADYAGSAPWSGLTGVPSGFADNIDNDTLYSPGAGLVLSGTAFLVDYAGTGIADSAARSDHNHWGQVWSGIGVGLTISSTDDVGVHGSGYNVGVYGQSVMGNGLTGWSSSESGETYGVWAASSSVNGAGVSGNALADNGVTYGVIGRAASPGGYGLYGVAPVTGTVGMATATSGSTYGIYGRTDSPGGWAGYFWTQTGAGVGINAPAGGVALDVQQGQVQVAEGIRYPDGVLQTEGFYRPRLPGPGSASTVTFGGAAGWYNSITIGADGLGLISYYHAGAQKLNILHCGNTACNSGNTIISINSGVNDGLCTSITIGADGLGLISYYDATNGDLKVLHCDDNLCNNVGISIVDSAGSVGWYTSITTGTDGRGLISYADSTNSDLKVLHCGSAGCSSGNTITTVDSDYPMYTSITIGADGLGLISYRAGGLRVLHCGNTTCNSGNTITTVDSAYDVGYFSSITIGADGLGLISYYDENYDDLKVLHCGNAACDSGNTFTTVDSAGQVGMYTSITNGAEGLGLISYYDLSSNHLKVLHCGNAVCDSGNTITTVDNAGPVGNQYTSITIGADGLGLISYYASTTADLKVFKCSNLACEPYVRVGR
jgi:hypothetical protein